MPELTEAWVDGYRGSPPLPAEDEAELRTFVMFRRLLLLAWIGSHADVDVAEELAPASRRRHLPPGGAVPVEPR